MIKYLIWEKIQKSNVRHQNTLILYIDLLLRMKYKVEEQGIHGFDDFLELEATPFERFAIELVVDGTSPELCSDILLKVLNSSDFSEDEYLRNVIFSEFVLNVQQGGIGVQELKLRLLSYLGIEGVNSFFKDRHSG